MKKLFFMRGLMSSGKSTFIKNNNLEDYTLSTDKIRLMFSSPALSIDYKEEVPQFNNKKVWDLLYNILEERMKKGELTIIDAMHIFKDDLSTYKKLAEKYRYRLFIIDFSNVPLEELLYRNKTRDEKKRVSESTIKSKYKKLTKEKIPSSFKIIKPDEFFKVIKSNPRDLNNYKKIHIFGDIHGCFNPLDEYFKKNKIKEDEFYIFLGDYFDRGLDNVKVFNFIKENIKLNNFIFLIGNHEDRLYKYACDDNYKLTYDLERTIEDFKDIKKSEIRGLIKGLSQIAFITYNDKKYIINHGGIPYFPEKDLDFYSSNSFIYGVSDYDINIDELYNNFMKDKDDIVYQIHGHRNYNNDKANKYDYSFNLDGNIEYGGSLRVITIDKDITFKEIKNNNYNPNLLQKEKTYDLIISLRNNKYIFEKELDENISSFNFSKEAFYNKIWNNMTTKTRGLFIDTKNYVIVARSYNKFFNLDERRETKYDYLKDNFIYPINFYLKYNGFLGILSVINGELVFGTKSRLDGKYSDYFKDIFYKIYNDKQINSIKKRIIKNNSSLIFEVIDCTNDKHIIEYKENKLILLDEIYNEVDFRKVDYDLLKDYADSIGIDIKKKVYTIDDKEALDKLFNKINTPDYKYNGKYIEGFVIEDFSGFMVKYKTKYYNLWKNLRNKMEHALKNNIFKTKSLEKMEIDFMNYLEYKYKDKDVSLQDINIIDERKDFLKEI